MKTSNSYTSVVNYLLSITFQIAISKLRQKYLINLLYFAEKYHFTEIKDLHAEVLLSLERGHKHLSHMFFFLEKHGRTLSSSLKSSSKLQKEVLIEGL